jgi:hypothetical protein
LKILEKLLDAAPYVKMFEVVGSTFQPGALAWRDISRAELIPPP